jgi:hypothetical protein
MMDLIGQLRKIMNKDASESFNQATDSLEAIADALGIGPAVGLSMFGICDPTMVGSTSTIVTTNLGGLVDDIFNDEFYMQVILNADAPGTAPEGEIRRITDFVAATQTFTTDAFSANVEANDLILILHETLLSVEIVARGTFSLSDVVNPEDNTRTEGNNYFRGCLLMPIEGAARFQPRLIVSYTGVGGIFSLDPGNPFSAAPGLVDYIIISSQTQFVPLADGADNRIPADVIGGKTDTANYTVGNTSSLMRYLKALLNVSKATVDGVYVDDTLGVAGTAWPIGTPGTPVSNIPDALTIAVARNLKNFYLRGSFVLGADITEIYTYFGELNSTDIDFNGHSAPGTYVNIGLTGVETAGITAFNCDIDGLETTLIAFNCMFFNTFEGFCQVFHSMFVPGVNVTVNGAGSVFHDCSGDMTLIQGAADCSSDFYGEGLALTLDASCAAGIINVYGDITLYDSSGGATVNDYTDKPILPDTGTFSYDETNAAEQTLATVALAGKKKIGSIWLDMVNVTRNTTIRVYHMIDGTNFRLFEEDAWTIADSDGVLIAGFTARADVQITLQCDGGGGGNVDVPYAIV